MLDRGFPIGISLDSNSVHSRAKGMLRASFFQPNSGTQSPQTSSKYKGVSLPWHGRIRMLIGCVTGQLVFRIGSNDCLGDGLPP